MLETSWFKKFIWIWHWFEISPRIFWLWNPCLTQVLAMLQEMRVYRGLYRSLIVITTTECDNFSTTSTFPSTISWAMIFPCIVPTPKPVKKFSYHITERKITRANLFLLLHHWANSSQLPSSLGCNLVYCHRQNKYTSWCWSDYWHIMMKRISWLRIFQDKKWCKPDADCIIIITYLLY